MWRVAIALIMIFSLGMVFAPAPRVSASSDPCALLNCLQVNIVTPAYHKGPTPPPADPYEKINVCTDFWVNATVANTTGVTQTGVTVTLSAPGTTVKSANPQVLPEIVSPDVLDFWWLLHCDSAGLTTIKVTASAGCGSDSDMHTVEQVVAPLNPVVQVTMKECPNGQVIPVSTTFGVKAIIKNISPTITLKGATGIIQGVSPNAELVNCVDNWALPDLAPGAQTEVGWTLHCKNPGDVPITVTVTGVDPTLVIPASCLVHQKKPAALKVTLTVPDKVCTNCQQNNFIVSVLIKETGGNVGVTAITATLAPLPDPNKATITPPTVQTVASLAAGGSTTLTWNAQCKGAGDAVFTINVTGYDAETSNAITPVYDPPGGVATVHQKDVIVDITAPAPNTKFNVSNTFSFTYRISNCNDGALTGVTAGIMLSDCTEVVALSKVHVVPSYGTAFDVTPTGFEALIGDMCACCYADVTWTLHCKCSGGDPPPGKDSCTLISETLTAYARQGTPHLDDDTVKIYQMCKAHLEAGIDAFPGTFSDADFSPKPAGAFTVCEDFTVVGTVANLGQAGATNVAVTLKIEGPASTQESLTKTITHIGCHDAGKVMWKLHCVGEGSVKLIILALSGTDENTGLAIPVDNIDIPCPLIVKQIPLTVHIIQPLTCTNFCVGECFTVKASVTNGSTLGETLTGVFATLYANGIEVSGTTLSVQLQTGQENPVDLTVLVAGETAEATWQVCCKGPGDVSFKVIATSTTIPIISAASNTETVHQKLKPEIAIEIVSPDNLDTLVATGQEFTVTAIIANKTAWPGQCASPYVGYEEYPVTITDFDLILHPSDGAEIKESPPDADFVILGGKTATLTWTLQCNESNLQFIDAYAVAKTYDCCPEFEAFSFPLLLWQYPTAHLEAQITSVPPGDISTGSNFPMTARIYNTGEADATEVTATLSVSPDGSVGLAPGAQGYTIKVGTLSGHGSGNNWKDVTWNLNCKQPVPSTFTVSAAGFDEYGWHKKQECQSTGNFILEAGNTIFFQTGGGLNNEPKGVMAAIFIGEASGLIGPFNLNVPISFNGHDMGDMVAMGAVLPDMDYTSFNDHVHFLIDTLCQNCPSLLELLEYFNLQGVNKDVMVFVGQIAMHPDGSEFPTCFGTYCASAGLLQVINGHFSGVGVALEHDDSIDVEGVMSFLDGEYCSTMAKEALRAIDVKFVEPNSTTVKQVAPSADADLGINKIANASTYTIGQTATFTITLTNNGPADATSIKVTDLLPAGVTYQNSTPTKGLYNAASGVWDVGDLAKSTSATLVITATVNTAGSITNTATITASAQHDPVTGNNSKSVTITGTTGQLPGKWSLNLVQGYNLISLPLIPIDAYKDPATMMGALNFVAVAQYTAKDPLPGEWHQYNKTPPQPSPPNNLTQMSAEWGYWINMSGAGTLSYDGYELVGPPPALPLSISVVPGWNLIGFKSTTPKTPAVYLAGIAGKYVMIYGFDGTSYFVAGAAGHENLMPGFGYWIAATLPGTIFP